MGYRSQVVLAISKELIPFLMLATSKNKEAEELVLDLKLSMLWIFLLLSKIRSYS